MIHSLCVPSSRWGQLTILSIETLIVENRRRRYGNCLCDCGKNIVSRLDYIVSGRKISCGCYRVKKTTPHGNRRHGMAHTPEHKAYYNAKKRCNDVKNDHYKSYGAKGIEFCFKSFTEFLDEIGPRPSAEYSLDRIDPFGNYEKGNVRWLLLKKQARNKRNNVYFEWNGKQRCIAELAEYSLVSEDSLRYRINNGWSLRDAMTIPLRVNQYG